LNSTRLSRSLAGLALLLVGVSMAAVAVAQTTGTGITQEYFVQQAIDEALLIRINAFEAEFESTVSGESGEVILHSGMPGSRIAPVFQYINPPGKARQLTIEVTSSARTERSEYGLELTRLTVWDGRSQSVSRAYQLLSFGMQTGNTDSEATWTVKIDSLLNAGRLFQKFGMKEMRLWANYLAAHLIQHRLHDYSIVYSMTREILANLSAARLQKIELATLQLQSAALIGLKRSGAVQTSAGKPDPVQSVLARTARLAQSMGFRFEQAQALSTSGTEYAEEQLHAQALEQYQRAAQIADSAGDNELATDIRESIVAIHALQGNASASSEVLQEIETQLVEKGAGDELALNLLAQGRLFVRNYRYREALEVLAEALSYQNNSAIRKQLNFELAGVFYQTGRLDEALASLQLTGASPASSQQRRANPVLDTGEALRLLANIYRARGEYRNMRQARSAQGQYKRPDDARYFYEQGLDEIAAGKPSGQQAASYFRQSYRSANLAGHADLKDLSLLQLCVLDSGSNSLCSNTGVTAAFKRLAASGVPRHATEAMHLWARLLVRNGRRTEAITIMERVTDEIHFLRHSLPGVLGAWYLERHEQLFEDYLELLTRPSKGRRGADGMVSLLALSKIRIIESYEETDAVPGDTDLLRVQLAQRTISTPAELVSGLDDKIKQGMTSLRQPFGRQFEYLSRTGLQRYLQGLGNDEIVLTYHISAAMAQVWVAHKGRVQRRDINNPAHLHSALRQARMGLDNVGIDSFRKKMDALGEQLLAPVADLLAETIYWIPAGPLLGFPLDALRVKGRYLVERHSVVNLLSFPANPNPARRLKTGPLQKIFLAGHPQEYSGDYATRLETSSEIRAIADIFVGPGLRIVQGAALLEDEFQDPQFTQAELVHLEMPGTIDLEFPVQSSIELSGTESLPHRTPYWSDDVQSQKMGAKLVFLSTSNMTGEPQSAFISQPGLISDFIDAGAQSVIAGFWKSGGRADEAFLVDFYRHLEASGDIANSLKDAKRQYLKANQDDGLYGWAGYQLFTD